MAGVAISIPIATVEEAQELPSRTYRLDLDAGRIVGIADGLTAVNQAIRKAIITPRFKCLIYNNQYGSEIEEEFIASNASRDYIEAACEGFVRDALKPDTRVLKIYDFSFDFGEDRVGIHFKADTIYGETEVKEVI